MLSSVVKTGRLVKKDGRRQLRSQAGFSAEEGGRLHPYSDIYFFGMPTTPRANTKMYQ